MSSAHSRINTIIAQLKELEAKRNAILKDAGTSHHDGQKDSLETRKQSLDSKIDALRRTAESVRLRSESIQLRQKALQSRIDSIKRQAQAMKTPRDKENLLRDAQACDRDREAFESDVAAYERDRVAMNSEAADLERESSSLERDGKAYNHVIEAERREAVSQVQSLFDEEKRLRQELKQLEEWNSRTWEEPVGGGDATGNPVTVSFGRGSKGDETLIADGDQTDLRDDSGQSFTTFREHGGHNHYGSGDGPHENTNDRGKYSGSGH